MMECQRKFSIAYKKSDWSIGLGKLGRYSKVYCYTPFEVNEQVVITDTCIA